MAGRNTTASVVQSSTIRCRVERQVDRPSVRLTRPRQPRQPRQPLPPDVLVLPRATSRPLRSVIRRRDAAALCKSRRGTDDPRTLIWLPPLCESAWCRCGSALAAKSSGLVSPSPPRSMRGLRSVRWPSPTGFFVAGEGRGRWATLGMRETESRSIQADGHDGEGKHSFNRG